MNFAAQIFYDYLADGSSQKAKESGDGEEYDPFWPSEDSLMTRGPSVIEPERLKDFGEEECQAETGAVQDDLPNSEARARAWAWEQMTEDIPNGDAQAGEETKEDLPNGDAQAGEETKEDLPNGDAKACDGEAPEPHPPEAKPTDGPEAHRKRGRRVSKTAAPKPPPKYLRFEDISAAAFTIQAGIQKTPCTCSRLSKQYGMEIYLKKEHLQYTGSAKERGARYLLTSLPLEQQKKGVILATDCSFSMAVAHHAVELNIPALVIMPAGCSPPRLRTYRDYGAMVISYGSTARDSLRHARHLAQENGYLCLEESDSAMYLAGLGTVGMEIHEQVPKLDAIVVPAGGQCGLLVGTAAAIKHLNSHVTVIVVEPEGYPLLLQSIQMDSPVKDMHIAPDNKLYGDLLEHTLSTETFKLAKRLVDKVISVREEDSLLAILRFQEFEHSTVDIEGALGLAAIFAGQLPELRGKRVAVVVSSANMELDLVRQCVDHALVLDNRVSRFTVTLVDVPGDMARLLDTLAREGVRLLDVCQRRHCDRADLFKAQVECVVETRDKTQSSQLRRTLSEHYPTLRWLDP